MKWCVAVIALGLAVLAISESASVKNYVKDYSKQWTKRNGNPDQDDINDYLDDTYLAVKTSAKSLNVDPMQLPDFAFKIREEESDVLIKVNVTNQVLKGMSALKRDGNGMIVENPKRMQSDSRARDLEIHGQVSLLSETDPSYNKTCTLFVDISLVYCLADFGLPEDKRESLTVAALGVYPTYVNTVLEKGCVEDKIVREDLISKYELEFLGQDFIYTIWRSLKEALNKSLKPFDHVKQ